MKRTYVEASLSPCDPVTVEVTRCQLSRVLGQTVECDRSGGAATILFPVRSQSEAEGFQRFVWPAIQRYAYAATCFALKPPAPQVSEVER